MTVSQVRRQWLDFAFVGTRRIEAAFPEWRMRAAPSPTPSLLSARLTERRGSHQRFARIRPTVRVGMIAIVVRQPRVEAFLERGGTGEVAAFQEASTQDTEEQFHLIEPRSVNRREVEHVFVTGVAEELAAELAGR